MESSVFQALTGMGPIGVLAIVVWILMKREERDRQDQLNKQERDREVLRLETESRVTLATALTGLTLSQQELARRIEEWTK